MKKITKEMLLKKKNAYQTVSDLAVIRLENGRVRLLSSFNPDANLPYQQENFGRQWEMSVLALSARCHDRGDFWDRFTEISMEVIGGIELTDGLSYEEVIDSLPEPIYAVTERELGSFFRSVISGTYTLLFHTTLADRIGDVLTELTLNSPVQMAAVESMKVSPCCDNIEHDAELFNLSFALQPNQGGVTAEFFIFNDAMRQGVLTLKTKYAGEAGYRVLGEIAGMITAKLLDKGSCRKAG